MTAPNDATQAQITAANPLASTWLSANAGSGKTRVLTDRVARLLLRCANPQRILCLTYTKAAASEMQNRLFQRLGEWSMLDDAALTRNLRELGEVETPDLARARTLFARAIEAPGGLKIQTIHSFCSSLLRQFPLESGVSPQFRELDDIGKSDVIARVLDQMAEDGNSALADIARQYTGDDLSTLAATITGKEDEFANRRREDVFAAFELDPFTTETDVLNDALTQSDLDFLMGLPPILSRSDKSTDHKLGNALSGLPDTPSFAILPLLETIFLFGSTAKAPFAAKTSTTPTKGFREGIFAAYTSQLHDIMHQIEAARPARIALNAAHQTWALHAFAADFLPAYRDEKNAVGALDFDDLIHKARALLTNESLAWVLFRLDGGIDHILVDEAQDTSPAQWQVIDALATEITAGLGARTDRDRSLFVVGDKKQSIYSFQGADARGFDTMADHFSARLENGPGLQRHELLHSFRSSPAILSAVDHTFTGNLSDGLGDHIEHRAFVSDLPGRVDVWPLVPKPVMEDEPAWHDPIDRKAANSPVVILANQIADKIVGLLQSGTKPGKNGSFEPISAGDILILVQRRGPLFDHLISACKVRNLPIAGADRLKVNAELAVRDLLALLSFLALPEDDLALATTLRSPLFGWSQADLYQLAHKRSGFLWASLRDSENHLQTLDVLHDLRRHSDFLRPYELLERILIRHSGRKLLMKRLGSEAEDGINEVLNQALAYEQTDVPTLTGFLARAGANDIEVKRQSDTSGGLIRVMTVHGAKGLESSVVILPDTIRRKSSITDSVIMDDARFPFWNLGAKDAPEAIQDAKNTLQTASEEERQRLLYVAMTRAKHWLIVGGAAQDSMSDDNWHSAIEHGVRQAGGVDVTEGEKTILRLQHGSWAGAVAVENSGTETDNTRAMAQPSASAPPTPVRMTSVSPSDLGGPKALPGDTRLSQDAAMKRGTDIHLLLEHLPDYAQHDWPRIAQRLLMQEDTEDLLRDASNAIDFAPDIFSPHTLAEVSLAAPLSSKQQLVGTIDRLIVLPDRIRVIDFKSNAVLPKRPEDTPAGILRQMGAYLEAVQAIWPDREISLEILWTSAPRLMILEHAIVRHA
ncbi:MAG: double-strand break repair helicase AddA [Boseongicola sp.]|nr:MAG: double-strand break repair helicase AddA [Boseongicola sp.]